MRLPRPRLHLRNRLHLLVLALFGIASFLVWLQVIAPVRSHLRWYDRVRTSLESLKSKRPPHVSRKEWAYVVGWTLNAHANCCSIREAVDPVEREAFADELDRKVAGKVDMGTIDWIWDEFGRISRIGSHYSEQFRPTVPERLRRAEFESWAGVEVP
jgi:hypothetical protein